MSFDPYPRDVFADEVADRVLRAIDLDCRVEDLCACGDGAYASWWACRRCDGNPVADFTAPAARCPRCRELALVRYVRRCRACGASAPDAWPAVGRWLA